MSSGAELVVEHFDTIVKPDGGSVRLIARDGSRLRVAYQPGTNEQCATCVIPTEQLAEMMRELVREQDPTIDEIIVEEASS